VKRGERYRLTIERPAAGGRMIARHDGAVVFVSGAIPGEVVEAEVEKVQRGTVWAAARQILERIRLRAHCLRSAAADQERDHRGCVPADRAHHARIADGGRGVAD
jgi:tRNA/tmRNA/rRNA uracil-C5-methylase (TrmA/RlmC/RlmD family)